MAGLKPATRIYLSALTCAALGLVIASIGAAHEQSSREILLALLFAGCMTLAWRFPLHFAAKTKIYLDSAVLIAVSLLFEPAVAMAIAGGGTLLAHLFQREGRDWPQAIFNAAQVTILAAIGALFLAAAGWDPARPAFGHPVPLVFLPLVGLVMYGVSILAVATVVAFESGQSLPASWRDAFRTDARVELLTQASLLSIGVLAAIVADAEPWGLVLLIAPVVTVYGILRRQSLLRQQAEQAWLASEASLTATQRVAGTGTWTMELASGRQEWSEEARRIADLPAAAVAEADALLGRIDPTDCAALKVALEAATEGRPFSVDYRVRLADGTIRMVHHEAQVVRDEHGVPSRMDGTVQDVTTRRALEAQLADLSERDRVARELEQTRRRLAEGREGERLRLARALHDGPVQDLLAVSYQLAALGGARNGNGGGAEANGVVDAVRHELLDVVGQLRGMIGELRPAGLAELGLSAALEGYVSGLARRVEAGMPRITLTIDPAADSLPQSVALRVFRIAQEALLNAVRHAAAENVTVTVERSAGEVDLVVIDDGHGFAVPEHLHAFVDAGHFGLVGIAERVEQASGSLTVHSAPGLGTTIRATLPSSAPAIVSETSDG
jgi:signal transduction histidine kinase